MYERSGTLVNKKFREYLLPTIMTSMAVSLASVVDGIIVGNLLGDTALAAVGLSYPVIYGLNLLYLLFAVGGVTCASVAKGRREAGAANQSFTISIVGGVLALCLYAGAVLALMEPITAALAQGNAELQALTAAYVTPLAFVGPPLMFSLGLAAFMRADGSPRMATAVSVVANLVNLVLDYLLIRYGGLGIAGAGLSTALGYVVGILVVLPYLFSKNRSFRFEFSGKEALSRLAGIAKTGLSKALTQGMSLLRALVLNAIIMFSLGSIGMSVMTVCSNVLMLAGIVISGTSDSLLPIVGTLFGERDYFGIHSVMRSALRVLLIACCALMVFLLLFPGVVGGWFGMGSGAARDALVPALRMYALCLPLYGLNQLMQNFYSTTRRVRLASAMAVLDGFVFVIAFALLFMAVQPGLLWLAYACAEGCTLLTAALLGRGLRKKEPEASPMLLLKPENEPGALWDTTIPATADDIVGLSGAVIDFCKENGLSDISANRMGVAVEEMAMNTALFNGEKAGKPPVTIDLLVRLTEAQSVLRFRDDGALFDPTTYPPEDPEEFSASGIEVLKSLADRIDYDRQLGFNVTFIQFAGQALA